MSRYPKPAYDDPTQEGIKGPEKDYQNINLAKVAVEHIRRMNAQDLSEFARLCVEDKLSSRLMLSLSAEEQEADMANTIINRR